MRTYRSPTDGYTFHVLDNKYVEFHPREWSEYCEYCTPDGTEHYSYATCQCSDSIECRISESETFAHTECVNCGHYFTCEGDVGAVTVAEKTGGREYPVCHPQDCWIGTEEQWKAWDAKYRAHLTNS